MTVRNENSVGVVSTKAAAKLIGASLYSLSRAVWAERFAPPKKDRRGFYQWTPRDIATAKQYFNRTA